jgi:cytochrome c peroxidase
MGGHEAEIGRRLSANPCYRLLFARAFPESGGRIDLDTVARALASFQRTIVGFDSAWDRAQAGKRPLDPDAARGERRFGASCGSCHSGANFTDYRLHYFPSSRRDRGAIRATGDTGDDGRFRTPSLRNVLLTAPYLHDGSAPTLGDAISRHGILMSAGDSAAIERFLAALTDRKVTLDRRFGPPPESCTVRG